MSRPHILVVTGLFPTPGGNPYAGSFVVQYLQALQAHTDITVLVPVGRKITQLLRRPTEHARIQGLNVWYVSYPTTIDTIFAILRLGFLSFRKYVVKRSMGKKLISLARTLHAEQPFTCVHGIELFVGDEAVPIGKTLSLPTLVTIHSLYSFLEQLYGRQCLNTILNNIQWADRLVTVSLVAKNSYPENIRRRMFVLPNGYTPKPIIQLPQRVEKFCTRKKILLFAGFFIDSKKPQYVIRVVKTFQEKKMDIGAILLGTGPLEARLRRQVRENSLENSIYFGGSVTPEEIVAYYNRADCVVQPSINESFSMVCLEGMFYSKPFVCTSSAGISEYVKNGREALIVPPNDYQAFYQAVEKLLVHDNVRLAMGQNAKVMSEQFTWSRLVDSHIQQYPI